jgi:hypothetical protein
MNEQFSGWQLRVQSNSDEARDAGSACGIL